MIVRRREPRSRSRLRSIAAASTVAVLVTVTGCDSGSGGDEAAAGATVVEACAAPVEEFGVTVDADGGPLPEPSTPDLTLPDPHELIGPATASLADEHVHPIQDKPTATLPVTVESCDDETVEITDTSRILAVDLYGTLAEIVFSLGLGDQVVGRDMSTGFPEAVDLPVVTPGGHDLNAEAVLALNPSVVLTDSSIGPPEVQQQLRDAGIPVVYFDPSRTLDGIPAQIRGVAGALGVPDAGEELLDRTETEIATAVALAPTDGEPLRIAFLYLRGGMVQLLAGPGSGADAMIQAIGATDVGTDLGLERPFTQITPEALIDAAPDVILMMSKGLESIGGLDGVLKIPGVAQTPAGADLRVVDMEDTDLLSFGPRTGAIVDALARAVYRPEP